MFEPFTQLASLDKLTPWNRSKMSTSILKPATAVSSPQLLLNATINSSKQFKSPYLSNCFRPIPHRRYFQAPFAGPPSYATLAQRFSTNPTPVIYHQAIKDGEAIKRKDYVDIHDVGGLNPKDYDVLLTDVDYNVFQDEIST